MAPNSPLEKSIFIKNKEVLIKTIAQAIPTYAMSVFPFTFLYKFVPIWKVHLMHTGGIQVTEVIKAFIGLARINSVSIHKTIGGMSFKKLHEFNLSMLGKNEWRLLTNANSLVARIYKSRYYPKTDFLHATMGHNPSFIWRRCLWIEPWLPDDDNPWIQPPRPPGLEDASVHSLFITGERIWDMDILVDIFNERDRNLILRIPISPNNVVDRLYWKYDSKGQYTVKSAYKSLTTQLSTLHPNHYFPLWKTLWSLNLPQKVKNFIWSLCNNCLPTKDQL